MRDISERILRGESLKYVDLESVDEGFLKVSLLNRINPFDDEELDHLIAFLNSDFAQGYAVDFFYSVIERHKIRDGLLKSKQWKKFAEKYKDQIFL